MKQPNRKWRRSVVLVVAMMLMTMMMMISWWWWWWWWWWWRWSCGCGSRFLGHNCGGRNRHYECGGHRLLPRWDDAVSHGRRDAITVAGPWTHPPPPYAAMADAMEETPEEETVHEEDYHDTNTVVVSTSASPPPPSSRTNDTEHCHRDHSRRGGNSRKGTAANEGGRDECWALPPRNLNAGTLRNDHRVWWWWWRWCSRSGPGDGPRILRYLLMCRSSSRPMIYIIYIYIYIYIHLYIIQKWIRIHRLCGPLPRTLVVFMAILYLNMWHN